MTPYCLLRVGCGIVILSGLALLAIVSVVLRGSIEQRGVDAVSTSQALVLGFLWCAAVIAATALVSNWWDRR